jgi:hypothetical protein
MDGPVVGAHPITSAVGCASMLLGTGCRFQAPPDPSTIRHARGASSDGVQIEAQPGLRGATSMSLKVVLDQVIRCSRLRAHCDLS